MQFPRPDPRGSGFLLATDICQARQCQYLSEIAWFSTEVKTQGVWALSVLT